MIVLYIILAVLVLLLAVVLLRTAAFHPKAEAFRTYAPVEFDREAAVTNLQQLIRCRTVSYTDASKEDPAEFEKLIALLPELYPHVYEKCTLTRLPDRGLLFYWAVMAAVTVLVLQLRIRNIVPDNALYTPGRQTLLLAVYASSFLHHLMPVRDTLVWAEDGLLLALCAAAAARFSQAQRRGKFSIAPIAALALTIGGFFPRMGAASTFIWAFVAAAGAGLCVVLLQKGETEDAEKQDFRVRQDA